MDCWASNFKAGIDFLNDPVGESYVTLAEKNLTRTSDEEPWEPSDYINKIVPGARDIQVELISRETNLNELHKKLVWEQDVGLVLMGPTIDRKSRPSLIVLTTRDKLYAIDPDDSERGVKFLIKKLEDKRIRFWTTDGLNEADCLYHQYNINLMEAKASCCLGIHIHMTKILKHLPGSASAVYPPQLFGHGGRDLVGRLEKFDKLAELWLDINPEEIHYNSNQLPHLITRPLNMTAINIIKKRCILVLPLAQRLEHFSLHESKTMSQTIFSRLINLHEPVRRAVIQVMKEESKTGEADIGIYSYLQSSLE